MLGQGQRLRAPLLGLISIAHLPEELHHPAEVGDLQIRMSTMEGRGGRQAACHCRKQTVLQVGSGGHEVARKERHGSYGGLDPPGRDPSRPERCARWMSYWLNALSGAQLPLGTMELTRGPRAPGSAAAPRHLLDYSAWARVVDCRPLPGARHAPARPSGAPPG